MIQIFIYSLLSPIIWSLLVPILLLTKKGRTRILVEGGIRQNAYSKIKNSRGDRELVIFHAASAGEFEQLKPILALIDRSRFFVFQTFTSPTIYTKEYNTKLADAVCYHPVDSIISALLFFLKLKPKLYVLNRHDLWPAHLFAAKILAVDTVLINANMHEKSNRTRFFFRSINRWMFESFSLILCGSKRISDGIHKFAPASNITVNGESRFDQVLSRKNRNKKDHFNGDIMDRKNIVLGSIIPSDYDILFSGIRKFLDSNKSKERLIVVPHEVAEKDLSILESKLEEFGFSYHRYSENRTTGDSDAIIIDNVGMLADLYIYAHTAYVGAGFGAGVHSVIEPAAYGVPTFFGPNIHILDEAIAMAKIGAGVVVENSDDVAMFLREMSEDKKYLALRDSIIKFVNGSKKVSLGIVEELFGVSG